MNDPPQTGRRSTGLAWLSLLVAFGGPITYMFLLDVPFLRSTGLLAFVMLIAGTALGFVAGARSRRSGRWSAPAIGVLLTVGFGYYFFGFGVLPETQGLDALARAPDFTAVDHTGTKVNLYETLASGPVLLVFYRGHW